jgi:hypothetical protein
MSATTFDRYGVRQPTPRRQLLTVGELQDLYGRDATVEVSSAAQRTPQLIDDDEIDKSVAPRRRFNPWLVIVTAVMLGAGGLLGYGLHRTGQLGAPGKLRAVGGATLAPTEDIPVDRDWEPVLTMGRIGAPLPLAEQTPVAPLLAPEADTKSLLSPPVQRPGAIEQGAPSGEPSSVETRTPAEIAADRAATEEALKRDSAKAREQAVPPTPAVTPQPEEEYPPGYIEAETPAKP